MILKHVHDQISGMSSANIWLVHCPVVGSVLTDSTDSSWNFSDCWLMFVTIWVLLMNLSMFFQLNHFTILAARPLVYLGSTLIIQSQDGISGNLVFRALPLPDPCRQLGKISLLAWLDHEFTSFPYQPQPHCQGDWLKNLWQFVTYSPPFPVSIWLVVWTPLKNMKVNWDDYSQLNGKIKLMFQTTN